VSLFVDTSVWSLALRRDAPADVAQVARLREALLSQEPVYTTGIVLQELLQGFRGPKARQSILERFAELPMVAPDRDDHVRAADVRNECRRRGVQLGTIDALLVQLCLRHELVMLATDDGFRHAARHVPLRVWSAR
jgi:predicted nucleic acid-binding protein